VWGALSCLEPGSGRCQVWAVESLVLLGAVKLLEGPFLRAVEVFRDRFCFETRMGIASPTKSSSNSMKG